ncbi:MOSC domain-containing protein [Thermus scotoductus]|uniref:MOSC domain-containing protein n=2 Tax=Thermus TaxID=270 RepID=A0A430SE20_THESC|nr:MULTISPECIES: MOSC domain-containing protein [Thermus]RTG98280.1 MOSC domain-containing protein [Thermus scotoductus]RTH12870.1 MOSC domain-containing protein [Thermus scotoductus]RTH13348.1 MOSC domain-containing protein [Thermus scotoductus]RTH14115.1 MOSC domain-containing protein [Thermus scotoductus]RTH20203.1 MOSC domain-containing protein [Thermus scotoductus]
MTGKVISLHLGLGSGLPKPQMEVLELIAGFGAKGDRHAGKDPDRAVLVAGLPAYEKAREAGIDLPFGALGENLLLDLDPHHLPPGTRLRVGEALLELAQVCTVCSSLSQFDLRLPKLLYGGRGLYARVLEGGLVRVGDPVRILVTAE